MTERRIRTTSRGQARKTDTESGNGHVDEAILQELLDALRALRLGDFSVRLPARRAGLPGQVATAFNDYVGMVGKTTAEIDRVTRLVGREGRMTERLAIGAGAGEWTARLSSINDLIDDLIRPMTEIARVIEAVARATSRRRSRSASRGGRSRASSSGSAWP
jgi:methyl-accepting chemotaxis protein